MNWALDNREIVLDTLVQHLWLTLPPIVLSLALTVPIAWLVHRSARLATPVVTASALLYTIPSLPLLIMIPVLIGTGLRSPINVVIALTLYGLALLVPVAVPAVRDTSQPVVHVAAAIGFTRSRRFWSVQLPLASHDGQKWLPSVNRNCTRLLRSATTSSTSDSTTSPARAGVVQLACVRPFTFTVHTLQLPCGSNSG